MESKNAINLNDIIKSRVKDADFLNDEFLVVRLKESGRDDSEWFFVVGENKKIITKDETLSKPLDTAKEFAGNEDVLRFIVGMIEEKNNH